MNIQNLKSALEIIESEITYEIPSVTVKGNKITLVLIGEKIDTVRLEQKINALLPEYVNVRIIYCKRITL